MEQRSGLVPYLFYDNAAGMIDWYKTVFGFADTLDTPMKTVTFEKRR